MSCSCAVVTTRTGLGSQLIDNEEALLVDFLDTAGMNNAITKLIDNKDLHFKIAHGGYLKAKDFNWDRQIDRLERLYRSWLQN